MPPWGLSSVTLSSGLQWASDLEGYMRLSRKGVVPCSSLQQRFGQIGQYWAYLHDCYRLKAETVALILYPCQERGKGDSRDPMRAADQWCLKVQRNYGRTRSSYSA